MTWGQIMPMQESLFAPTPLPFKKSRQDSLNSDFSYPVSLSPSSSTSSISEDLLPIDKDMLNLIPDLWSGETDDPITTQKTQDTPQLFGSTSTWQQRPSSWYSHTSSQTQLASFNTTPLTEENLFLLSDSTTRQPQVAHVEQKELEHESQQQPLSHTHSPSTTARTKSEDSNPSLNTGLYKTELCDQFTQKGHCPYGTKCQFAHGAQELKSVKRPSNWKTKPCANWTKFGKCRYGKRCCFKHGDE